MKTADVVSKREALEELVRSDGWHIFCAHVVNEFRGIGYQNRMASALQTKDPMAPHVVHQTALAIVGLLEWPASEVSELKGSIEDE